jgi:predicted ABC-type ATPase
VIDPDLVARTLQPPLGASDIAAGREVLAKAETHIQSRDSFAIETTLSGRLYLRMLDRTRGSGYSNVLIYVGTRSVEINLARIANRVELGGHDVPESDVRRRYHRSLTHLPVALEKCDYGMLFDNSEPSGYRIVAVKEKGSLQWISEPPSWAAVLGATE